jgi:hypothetical protein
MNCLTKNRLEGYRMFVGKQISSGGNWTQGKRKREGSNRIWKLRDPEPEKRIKGYH